MSARFFAPLAALLASVAPLLAADSPGRAEQAPAKNAAKVASPEVAIRETLARPVELKFVEIRLVNVAKSLEKTLGVPVRLDQKALDKLGISGDRLITFQVAGISARSALDLLLREPDLTWVIAHEMLLITTPEEAETQLSTEVYDVADLVIHGDATEQPDFDALINMITATIQPNSWDAVGGRASITPFEAAKIKAIVLSQRHKFHQDVATLLADLRKARREKPGKEERPEAPATAKEALAARISGPQSREEAIRRALAKPVELQFDEKWLLEVVPVLKEKAGVQVVIDDNALRGVGIEPDTCLSTDVADIKLRSALDFILRPLDLTWTVTDEVLLITTPEEAESILFAKVYDVSDLPAYRNEQGEGVPDFDSLSNTITACIEPTSWDAVGGPGSIAPFDATGIKVLVVRQTWKIHEEIEALLEKLRKVRGRPLAEEEIAKLPPVPEPVYKPRPPMPAM